MNESWLTCSGERKYNKYLNCGLWIAALVDSKHKSIMVNTWATTHRADQRKGKLEVHWLELNMLNIFTGIILAIIQLAKMTAIAKGGYHLNFFPSDNGIWDSLDSFLPGWYLPW